MSSPPEPASEGGQSRAAIGILPELSEAFLEGPGSCDLEVTMLQCPEDGPFRVAHVVRPHGPEVLRSREPRVVRPLQGPVFDLSHLVHRLRV